MYWNKPTKVLLFNIHIDQWSYVHTAFLFYFIFNLPAHHIRTFIDMTSTLNDSELNTDICYYHETKISLNRSETFNSTILMFSVA